MSRESKFIVFVAVLASLLEIIDTSIVNVAIPSMMGNLGATIEDISMVVTGYAIANAIILPLSAWLGNQFGRRRYYLDCILIFTATSVACGFAPNLNFLIVFRILQGPADGALLPTSQALIYEQFPKEKAGMAGAIFGMSVMIGPTLGPTLGGYLTDTLGWRSIFNVNLPLGLFAFFIGYLFIREPAHRLETQSKAKESIDYYGLLLLAIGIGCLQYALERGNADDWFASNNITLCALIAITALPTFVWWELRVEYPIMNLRLFKDRIVISGVLLMASLGLFLYSLVFTLPVFIGRSFHYNATQIGELFIPGSLLTAFVMPFVGKQLQKTDPRIFIGIGLILVEVCCVMFAQTSVFTSRENILHALYVRGIAMGFLFVPINSTILSQFKGVNLGQVSGLLNLSRQIGGSIGVAMVGTLFSWKNQQNYIDLAPHISLLNTQTQQALMQTQAALSSKMTMALGSASPYAASVQKLYERLQSQIFVMSFNQLMYTLAFAMLFAFIPLSILRLRKAPVPVNDAH